ncbi:MAG: hypothetical protein JWO31_3089, partial [Phycisphaerales bacterium]|nr:hypothetical protein [Phycisphaerales bacterium]
MTCFGPIATPRPPVAHAGRKADGLDALQSPPRLAVPAVPDASTQPTRSIVPADGAPAAAADRLPMFDAMRVVAAFAVVCTHAADVDAWRRTASALQFGVAFFTVSALVLLAHSLRRRPDQSWADYAVARAGRLLVPFALWTAVYVGFYYALHRATGHVGWVGYGFGHVRWWRTVPSLMLGGAAVHLWFLPFILVACVAGFPVLRYARGHPAARRWMVPVLVGLGMAAAFLPDPPRGTHLGTRTFLRFAAMTAPTVCWGLALA